MKMVIILEGFVLAKDFVSIYLSNRNWRNICGCRTVCCAGSRIQNPAVKDQIFIDAQTHLSYHTFPWFSGTFHNSHSYYLSAIAVLHGNENNVATTMLLNESFWQAVHSALAFVGNVATMFTRQYVLCGFALDSDLLRSRSEMDADGLYEIACQASRSSRIERSLRLRHYFYILSMVSAQPDEIFST